MSSELTAHLLAVAREAGAAVVGVTHAGPFVAERAALERSGESGRSGPLHFTYDDPGLATDLSMSFPWARHLVAVGCDYLPEGRAPAERGAIVGRFATSDHYRAVRAATGAVATRLRDDGYRAEVLIDDNRLVDRAAAVRAGLGWWGKSTMVLAPGHGPWMLLGSVVTDAPLAVTSPLRRDCGRCDACIPACPTGALGEWGLDARRCLSTWLQTAGSIPHWVRPLVGRRIYGCDDCLTACPPGRPALVAAVEKPVILPFADLLALTDDELMARFPWWYVPRREGRFLRRNALIAAGNSMEKGCWAAIERHSGHPSSMVRGHAYWALGRCGRPGSRDLLRLSLDTETVPEARGELILSLLMVNNPHLYQDLLIVDQWVRTNVEMRALAVTGSPVEAGGGAGLDLLVLHQGSEPDPPDLTGATLRCRPLADPDVPENVIRVYDPDRRLGA